MSNYGNNAKTQLEYQFPQPKEKQSFAKLAFNRKEGSFFGRTCSSWGKILLFYSVYYTVLAGLFSICMQGLYSTLSKSEPKWKLDASLIGSNPGMGFRPLSEATENGSIIHFHSKNSQDVQKWKGLLDEFLKPYNGTGRKERVCDFTTTIGPDEVCLVDIKKFGDCSPEKGYGYDHGRPCVFLKLNKIYNWQPVFYTDPNDVPEDMPKSLREHINSTNVNERNQIWVSCKGQNDPDAEAVGEIEYFPSQGFPGYYYPYRNQEFYLSPLIAVQFINLKRNQFIKVECRAWAKNIQYVGGSRDRMGSVAFQLMHDIEPEEK